MWKILVSTVLSCHECVVVVGFLKKYLSWSLVPKPTFFCWSLPQIHIINFLLFWWRWWKFFSNSLDYQWSVVLLKDIVDTSFNLSCNGEWQFSTLEGGGLVARHRQIFWFSRNDRKWWRWIVSFWKRFSFSCASSKTLLN